MYLSSISVFFRYFYVFQVLLYLLDTFLGTFVSFRYVLYLLDTFVSFWYFWYLLDTFVSFWYFLYLSDIFLSFRYFCIFQLLFVTFRYCFYPSYTFGILEIFLHSWDTFYSSGIFCIFQIFLYLLDAIVAFSPLVKITIQHNNCHKHVKPCGVSFSSLLTPSAVNKTRNAVTVSSLITTV